MRATLKIVVLAAVPLLALLGCPSDGPTKPSAKGEVAQSDPAKTPADGDMRRVTFQVSGMSWRTTWGSSVAKSLEGTDGVTKVTRKGSSFVIQFDPKRCDTKTLAGVIEKAGYDPKLEE